MYKKIAILVFVILTSLIGFYIFQNKPVNNTKTAKNHSEFDKYQYKCVGKYSYEIFSKDDLEIEMKKNKEFWDKEDQKVLDKYNNYEEFDKCVVKIKEEEKKSQDELKKGVLAPMKDAPPDFITPEIKKNENGLKIVNNPLSQYTYSFEGSLGQLKSYFYYGDNKTEKINVPTFNNLVTNVSWLDSKRISMNVINYISEKKPDSVFPTLYIRENLDQLGLYIIDLEKKNVKKVLEPKRNTEIFMTFAIPNKDGVNQIIVSDGNVVEVYDTYGKKVKNIKTNTSKELYEVMSPVVGQKGYVYQLGKKEKLEF
jgi:hypothetical protein